MPRRVLVLRPEHSPVELEQVAAPDEANLQETLRLNPGLLPVDDLGLDAPLLIIGRETGLASGRIDLLGLCRSGDVVIAEFKTGTQNSDFRHVLSQLIDYGSDLWRLSIDDFNEGVVQKYLRESPSDNKLHGLSLQQIATATWDLTETEAALFTSRLEKVLADGDFHFVVVSQNFRPSVVTSAEYLNATSKAGTFHLVELVMLTADDMTAYAAQVIATPSRGGQSTSSKALINEAEFLRQLDGDDYREAMRDLFANLRPLGIKFGWGSRGTSLRIDTPDRDEPISFGWAFPEGATWQGVKHLTIGYDKASVQQTPSVADALQALVDEVAQIPGATLVTRKNVVAHTFTPESVPSAWTSILEAIEHLRDAVNQVS